MPTPNTISLVYYGGDADQNRLNLYDASNSYEGLARTLAILGHYYLEKKIITKAPNSAMPLYLVPPEDGSFKQLVMVGVVSSVLTAGVSVPYTVFATRVIESWVPAPEDKQLRQVIELLTEQNALLRQQMNLPTTQTAVEKKQENAVEKFIEENSKDLQTLRSVTSQSFKKVFRPIRTGSAKQIGLIGGLGHTPKTVVDEEVLARIEADAVDKSDVVIMGVVNSFSRGSKTGIVFSRDYMSSFRIEYTVPGKMPREDGFSWSQYSGKPIRMTGRFVRFFDNKVKKLLVNHIELVTDQDEIDDYFNTESEIRIP